MKVEITLKDINGKDGVILQNAGKEEYVFLSANDGIAEPDFSNPVMIKIEDLKIALKKITAR